MANTYLTPPVQSPGFSDARNGRGVTWNGKALVHSPINTWLAKLDVRDVGNFSIGSKFSLAPLHVGNLNVSNSDNAQILISRTVQSSSSTSEHAFSDSSNVVGGNSGLGYNSFDARITYSGSNSSNHYAGFQASPVYGSSGTLSHLYLHTAQPSMTAGTITNLYGYYLHNMTGTGTVTNQYGVYIANLTKGTNNYAFYSVGSTPSVFGGPISVGGGTSISTIITDTYTPTLTAVTNVAATTANACRVTRIGNRVRVSGLIAIDPTAAAGTSTEIAISLPYAKTLASAHLLAGGGSSRDNGPDIIAADTVNNRATLLFLANSTANANHSFWFEYDL